MKQNIRDRLSIRSPLSRLFATVFLVALVIVYLSYPRRRPDNASPRGRVKVPHLTWAGRVDNYAV